MQDQKKIDDLNKQLAIKQTQRLADSQAVVAVAAVKVAQPTNCADYRGLVAQYAWNVDVAMAVMQAESGCNPIRDNAGLNRDGSVDYGLFQVNSVHAAMVGGDLEKLRDPATNVRIAFAVYSGSGWRAWSVFNSGSYLRYME